MPRRYLGIEDLATANGRSGDVSVLLGVGDGTFAPQQTFDARSGSLFILSGDFNGDREFQAEGDINQDGAVDLLVVQNLIAILGGG